MPELVVNDATTLSNVHTKQGFHTVLSFIEPGATKPQLIGYNPDVLHLVLPRIDMSMDESAWVCRFGGAATDLFQPSDMLVLETVAQRMQTGATLLHCAQGPLRPTV